MKIAVISLFPELFEAPLSLGVVGRAVAQGLVEVQLFDPRDHAEDKHKSVDDRPFGGGAGMVMTCAPLRGALRAAMDWIGAEQVRTVLMSPAGKTLDQATAQALPERDNLVLICGRYEGIDQRFIDAYVDEEWSIGDYVISGGELAALVVIDALARHVPGVLGNNRSNIDESHLDGRLDYPQYTRPENTDEGVVPEALLSGDHGRVSRYRRREALRTTLRKRPDLLTGRMYGSEDRALLQEIMSRDSENSGNLESTKDR